MAREGKLQSVDRAFVETRLADAHAYVQQATTTLELVDGPQRFKAAMSSAILAGIAASDVLIQDKTAIQYLANTVNERRARDGITSAQWLVKFA